MKNILLILFAFRMSLDIAYAQIPNGSFENWLPEFSYEKPLEWYTNQDTFFARIERSTDAIDGEFALKMVPGNLTDSKSGCTSHASIWAHVETPVPTNSVVSLYVKSIPFDPETDQGVYLKVDVAARKAGEFIFTHTWTTFDQITEYTRIELPLPNEAFDEIGINVIGAGVGGVTDGHCGNPNYSWIDGITIESSTSVEDGMRNASQISVFPNPTNGIVFINSVEKDLSYELYSVLGQIIDYGQVQNDQINIHQKGMFALRLYRKGNESKTLLTKLIVVD